MRSSLILLFAQCIYGSFLSTKSMQNRLITQLPAQYLYTSQDYQKINELESPRKNSYIWYYTPVPTNEYVMNANWEYDEIPMESKLSPKKTLLIQRIPNVKVNPGHLSVYLKPPAIESISNYAKYRSHSMNLEDKEQLNFLPQNHRPDIIVKNKKKKKIQDQGPIYIRDHDPLNQIESESEILEHKQNIKKTPSRKEPSGTLELSADGDRIEFQIQGHEGPKTYIFGFDTGDGKNRQFRLEERLKDGTVKGHYGYYDARGKLRAIKYLARPLEGYKEKHHESNNFTYKKE